MQPFVRHLRRYRSLPSCEMTRNNFKDMQLHAFRGHAVRKQEENLWPRSRKPVALALLKNVATLARRSQQGKLRKSDGSIFLNHAVIAIPGKRTYHTQKQRLCSPFELVAIKVKDSPRTLILLRLWARVFTAMRRRRFSFFYLTT